MRLVRRTICLATAIVLAGCAEAEAPAPATTAPTAQATASHDGPPAAAAEPPPAAEPELEAGDDADRSVAGKGDQRGQKPSPATPPMLTDEEKAAEGGDGYRGGEERNRPSLLPKKRPSQGLAGASPAPPPGEVARDDRLVERGQAPSNMYFEHYGT
ncbi:MAG: hypothetical protein KC731_18235, partial [Myxococcales bacterium]|nr:hypothetical protein [Myxococcales bacterium]